MNTGRQGISNSSHCSGFLLKSSLGWGELCSKSDLLHILKINVSYFLKNGQNKLIDAENGLVLSGGGALGSGQKK